MKKTDLSGLGEVFKFTILQLLKSKAFIIISLISFLAVLAMSPLMALINQKSENKDNNITKAYIINSSEIKSKDLIDELTTKESVSETSFTETDKNYEELSKEITENHSSEIIIKIESGVDVGGFYMNIYYDKSSDVNENEIAVIADSISEYINNYKSERMASDEIKAKLNADVSYQIIEYKDFVNDKDKDNGITQSEYWAVYIVVFVFFMVITLSGSVVSTKVAEEKNNRIVEYLMTSVRPMALIGGKVLAVVVVYLGYFAILFLCGIGSFLFTKSYTGDNPLSGISNIVSLEGIKQMPFASIAFCFVIMILGMIMYSLLAGLFAASISKMEDLQQSMRTYSFILVIGFMLSFYSLTSMIQTGISGIVKFSMYFPLSSVMILPGTIFIGKATMSTIIISIALLIVTNILVLKFVSLVYETVIVTNGKNITLKQMIEIAKGNMNKTNDKSDRKEGESL